MYCQRCGTQVTNKAEFCSSCGLGVGQTTQMPTVREPASKSELELVQEALHDIYDVREIIGRGGMATVYRAREKDLGRDVAIKVLPFSHTHDTSFVERFANEARTSARLEHANIIPIYRVGRSGSVIYLAMRYLSGPNLAELIEQVGPMQPKDIRRILVESARALGYAHDQGVVHRDVKPDNIMFKESGEIVMCDFGIAKAVSGTSLTGTGVAVGTPLYMSPEQVKAQPLDGRSDLYSLGIVAYQCLTKTVPFDGEDAYAIGFSHINDELPVPELKTAEHHTLFRIISKLMAKDPAERFPDADSLVAALSAEDGIATEIPTLSRSVTDEIEQMPRRQPAPPTRAPETNAGASLPMTPVTPIPRPSLADSRLSSRKPKKRKTGVLVGMLFLATLGGAGGGGYYYVDTAGGVRPAISRFPVLVGWLEKLSEIISPPETPVAVVDSLPADTISISDSVVVEPEPVEPEPEPPTTGHLIVSNLAGDATLWIDDRFVAGARHELAAGPHRVRVVAPGFQPYSASVKVSPGDTVVHRVSLRMQAQCEALYEAGYNLNETCFEVSPRLQPGVSSAVQLRSPLARRPRKPVILGIQVLPDGRAGTVVVRDPSDVAEFSIQAVAYAKGLTYAPATKRGRAVTGWVELPFYAPRQQ